MKTGSIEDTGQMANAASRLGAHNIAGPSGTSGGRVVWNDWMDHPIGDWLGSVVSGSVVSICRVSANRGGYPMQTESSRVPGRVPRYTRWEMATGTFCIIVLVVFGAIVWMGIRLTADSLSKWASIAVLLQGAVGLFTLLPVLWAVLRYRRAAEDQQKAKHYQAWRAITEAQGKPGSCGRGTAIEDLHRDGQILLGVNLSGGAYLAGLALPGANLARANLREANLEGANLGGTNLESVDLHGANLRSANLQDASLKQADLQKTELKGAKLHGSSLEGAKLQEADLSGMDLAGCHLGKANLRGANLRRAGLRFCFLDWADLHDADLGYADFRRAHLKWVNLQGANMEGAVLAAATLNGSDLSTARKLTRDQVLSTQDWRGARLPPYLLDLQLSEDVPEGQLDRLGRTWKPRPPMPRFLSRAWFRWLWRDVFEEQ
jgi:uncharacterized protein YjbI with pentapeptide repeats